MTSPVSSPLGWPQCGPTCSLRSRPGGLRSITSYHPTAARRARWAQWADTSNVSVAVSAAATYRTGFHDDVGPDFEDGQTVSRSWCGLDVRVGADRAGRRVAAGLRGC